MKRFTLITAIALLMPLSALAQDPAPEAPKAAPAVAAPAATSDLDTNKDGKVDAAETAAATDKDAGVGDVIKEGGDVAKAVGDLKDAKSDAPKGMLIMGLLAAIFKLLLSLIKVVGKNVAWFKSKDGKRVLKYSTIGLGAAAGLVANLMFGMSWMDAGLIMLSGPLSVAIHEYTKDSKDTPPPEEAKADA